MFIGHFALGFAAKRFAPGVSLAVLFAAAQLADLLWPLFVAAGIESVRIDPSGSGFLRLEFISYPYSHSLLMLVVWGLLLASLHRLATQDASAFLIIAGLVVSHWTLDWTTHRPDLPVYPGGPTVGLGLWNSVPGTLATELTIFAAGLSVYLGATEPRDATGRWSLLALVAFLIVAYFSSLMGTPPSVTGLWVGAVAGAVVLLIWSWWADGHRRIASAARLSE